MMRHRIFLIGFIVFKVYEILFCGGVIKSTTIMIGQRTYNQMPNMDRLKFLYVFW